MAALTDSEKPEFGGWDVAIDLGDHAGNALPNDAAGIEVLRQFGALVNHPRGAIYSLSGNHDREGPGEPDGWWFRRYLDPMGENPDVSGVVAANRPYLVVGEWDRYKFQIGNIVFLMMSDVVRPQTNLRGVNGGDPGGVVRQATFDWWKQQVEGYRGGSEIVITCHHYLLKNTTCCTGDFEGGTIDAEGNYQQHYHGPGKEPIGAGRLHYIDERSNVDDFVAHLTEHPGDVDVWLGAHSHVAPAVQVAGRALREYRLGCHFINCAALTKHHASAVAKPLHPRSRMFLFMDGAGQLIMRNWYHDDSYAPVGFSSNRVLVLNGKIVRL